MSTDPGVLLSNSSTATQFGSISNNTISMEKSPMTEFELSRSRTRCPSHPGALLGDIIPATGKSKTEIANLLGISRQQLYDIINEKKPVSPAVAARLGKMFGDGAA